MIVKLYLVELMMMIQPHVCVRHHEMPASQHASQFFVIRRACSVFADLSIVIGFPVSIRSMPFICLMFIWQCLCLVAGLGHLTPIIY